MPKLKKEDIILKLMELGVTYESDASYNDLYTLLKVQERKAPEVEKTSEKIVTDTSELTEKEEEIVEEVKQSINPFVSFESKTPLSKKAHDMRKKLINQPLVTVYIPLGHEEKVGSTHQVTLNGYTMFIRKGQAVEVPVQVKQVLDAKFAHQLAVREHPKKAKGGNVKLQEFD